MKAAMIAMEVFFIWIVLAKPDGGVDTRVLKRPFHDANECVDVAVKVHNEVSRKFPQMRGALCWSIDEVSEGDIWKSQT